MKKLPNNWKYITPEDVGEEIAVSGDGEYSAWIEENGDLAVGGSDYVAGGYVPKALVTMMQNLPENWIYSDNEYSTTWKEDDGSFAVGGTEGVATGYVPHDVVMKLYKDWEKNR